MHANDSPEPNFESDSEGFLASRAIEKLCINESKRSIESDYGAPSTSNLPKKMLRRRRKTKRLVTVQMDIDNNILKPHREKRGLGKRKRLTHTGVLKKKTPVSPKDEKNQCDHIMMSDGESGDSMLSSKTTETCYSQDDDGDEGDNEESDWPRDLMDKSGNTNNNCRRFYRTRQCYAMNNHIYSLKVRDDFILSPSMYSKENHPIRSAKGGIRKILTPHCQKFCHGRAHMATHIESINVCGENGVSTVNQSEESNHQKSKRYSSKRLRCGSASFTSSDSKLEFLPITNHRNCTATENETITEDNTDILDRLYTAQFSNTHSFHSGSNIQSNQNNLLLTKQCNSSMTQHQLMMDHRPPFKKEATEQLIFGSMMTH